uniref:DNA replication complex GINS protein PSF2 putative n=1 Tax=Albugo laibachii Nc14 TaxID=890382 RepID=F0WE68_9STRA|nr:DNA replication complex GINS protein PSF2 putative [Albugo laibachii Nc14]|eukprot:CCA19497.1 DNA replication complex GINS protein PSF2 putative [Albugo laibachii Nc14]
MNARSSRSHSVLIVAVVQRHVDSQVCKEGKLSLLDLAGSEIVSRTGAGGQQLEEAKTIKKSLSALGMFIPNLASPNVRHIPYRESKLTRIVEDSLSGNVRTTLILNASSSILDSAETLSTLRFGQRATKVKNQAVVNEPKHAKGLSNIFQKLQLELQAEKDRVTALEHELVARKMAQEETNSNLAEVKEAFIQLEREDRFIRYAETSRMQLESNHKKTVDHLDATLEQKKMEYSQLGTEHGRLMVEQCNWNPSVMRVDEVIQPKKRLYWRKGSDFHGKQEAQNRDGNVEAKTIKMLCDAGAPESLYPVQRARQCDSAIPSIRISCLSYTTMETSEESLEEMDQADVSSSRDDKSNSHLITTIEEIMTSISCTGARELEFLAEQELIKIIPYFQIQENHKMLHFISGDFGPFQAGIPLHVPLWLAIMLKQLRKCRILPPEWLTIENLTTRLEEEIRSDVFEPLPFHYMEVSSLLLKHAAEDIEQVEHIRSLLEDLQNVRQDKIRSGLCKISSDVQSGGTAYAIQMNNISALEINSVRRLMTNV